MRLLLVFFALGLSAPAIAGSSGPVDVGDLWLLEALGVDGAGIQRAAFPECREGNLLAGKQPHRSNNALNPRRLTDGVMPETGGQWDSALTSKLKGESAFVTYDLGGIVPLTAFLVQGDNNDKYDVSVSLDGKRFDQVWTAPFHPKGGMQTRLGQGLDAIGRYVRLGFPSGDDAYSIGEFQAFCAQPSVWPPPVDMKKTPKTEKNLRKRKMARGKIIVGLLGLLAFLGLFAQMSIREHLKRGDDEAETGSDSKVDDVEIKLFQLFDVKRSSLSSIYSKMRWILPLASSTTLIYTVYYMREQLKTKQDHTWIGISVGLSVIGFVWLWRNQDGRKAWIWAERAALMALIAASAVTWVNFGTFHGSRAVHYWDTFHYYVGSKYFKENGYAKLYKCAATAEMDDGRKKEVLDRKMRDLTNNALISAKLHLEDVSECREAFTPKRWAAFRQDLRLFRSEMGKEWWQKMFKDHGYNPTPVWNLVGSTLTNIGWSDLIPPDDLVNSPANIRAQGHAKRKEISERFSKDKAAFKSRVERFALLDASLYLGLFLLLGWAFGLRVMAFSMLVWASGYPWAYFWTGGGYGRVPWLFFAVAGLALLKKGYGFLGGWSITWSALHRVFPAALAGGVTLQIILDLYKKRRLSKRQKRIMLGATLALAVLVPASIPVAGTARAYPDFIQNSMKHKGTPLTNNMGLQTVLSYRAKDIARKTKSGKFKDPFKIWKVKRKQNFKNLRVVYIGILLGLFALIGYLGRWVEEWEVTAMSTIFLMTIFELTCYYYNFIILMAPLAFKRPKSAVVLLGAVIYGQWLQLKISWYDEQYTAESAVIIGAALFILLERAWEIFQAQRAAKAQAKDAEGEAPASA